MIVYGASPDMSREYESVDVVGDETVRYFATAVLIAALTAGLAQLSIPLPGGVPFSLQPFGSFFAGLVLGPLWGGLAMALYLLAGALGAPVFANGATGLQTLLYNDTSGYLWGFLAGAVVSGAIAHRQLEPRSLADVSVPVQVLALATGLLVIYAVGVPYFSSLTGAPVVAVATGMAPFFGVDVVKLGIAVAVVESGELALGR